MLVVPPREPCRAVAPNRHSDIEPKGIYLVCVKSHGPTSLIPRSHTQIRELLASENLIIYERCAFCTKVKINALLLEHVTAFVWKLDEYVAHTHWGLCSGWLLQNKMSSALLLIGLTFVLSGFCAPYTTHENSTKQVIEIHIGGEINVEIEILGVILLYVQKLNYYCL